MLNAQLYLMHNAECIMHSYFDAECIMHNYFDAECVVFNAQSNFVGDEEGEPGGEAEGGGEGWECCESDCMAMWMKYVAMIARRVKMVVLRLGL